MRSAAPERRGDRPRDKAHNYSRTSGSAPPTSSTAPRWWPWALLGVALTALAWRLGYLDRLNASILGGSLVSDAETYWTWSTWLLEHGWWGKHPFFMGPLYPYTVAALRAVTGGVASDPGPVLLVQAAWGSLACLLLADAARRVTASPALGIATGLLVALYQPAVFFDGLVLMESQLFALEALLLWGVAAFPPSPRTLLAAGVGIGLLAAGRASSLVLLPALLFARWPGWRGAAGLAAGVLVVTAPIALRNLERGGEWIPFTYNGGLNLAIGNGPEANGTFVHVTGAQVVSGVSEPEGVAIDGREYLLLTTGRAYTPLESSNEWARRARTWIAEHPGRALALASTKLALLWNAYEMPQVENIAQYRRVAGPLGLPYVGTFAFVGMLALVGLGVVLTRWKASAPAARFIAIWAIGMTIVILPFFVTDRYRHHLLPAAFVLAAVAVQALRSGKRRGLLLAGLVAGAIVVHRPVPAVSPAKLEWGIAADLGARYFARGDLAQALAEFARADSLGRMLPPGTGVSRALERAALHHNHAMALERAGHIEQAERQYERALAEAPDNAQIRTALAALRVRQGRVDEARAQYDAMAGLVEGGVAAAMGKGRIAAQAGRFDEARTHFAEAARLDPESGEGTAALVRLEAQAGDVAAAERALVAGEKAGWTGDSARLHRALVLALKGDKDGAITARAAVAPEAIRADRTLTDVDRAIGQLLARP